MYLLALSLAACAVGADGPVYRQRWFYAQTNLQVEKNAVDLAALIRRASKAGFNGVVLADYKLNILDRVPRHYFTNLELVKAAAKEAKVEIIPAAFAVGYSSGILAHDPNLAEGLEVKDAPFVVKGGVARLVPLDTGFRNGGLEEAKGKGFAGFGFQDGPGVKTVIDRETFFEGKASCRMENFTKGASHNARITQRVKVRPHACYRFSARVKTKALTPAGNFKLMAMGAKGPLTFQEGEAKPTQAWAEVDVVFNTQGNDAVTLYAGVWGGKSGTLWVDDMRLEELSLVNVLRRPGCPFTVTSADGKTAYVEGKDFAPVRDAKLGQEPWAGEYGFRHRGAELRLLPGSRIKEGERLLVGWYHPVKTHSYQVMCCLSEPRLYEVLKKQAKLVHKHLAPKTWFFSHDEIRVANWCRGCQGRKKTPGQLLAENMRRCVAAVRAIDPKAKIIVWSDMFDPNHNARAGYYLVNGTLAGSWEGVPKDVAIANWNGGKARESLKFFSGRGHEQVIAGYYDAGVKGFTRWHEAAKGVKGVTGFMYTTWRGDYSQLEAYGRLLRNRGE